jgi:hypothetical protein
MKKSGKEGKSFQSAKSGIIPVLLIITVAAAYIDSRDPQPDWWRSMQSWLKSGLAKPESDTSTPITSPSTASRTFLGRSQTGYELWADKSCVYVKGITEADLARLNTDVWGFKNEIKVQTGYKCVLFE